MHPFSVLCQQRTQLQLLMVGLLWDQNFDINRFPHERTWLCNIGGNILVEPI